jgi:glycine C-acetyltransferase/8-amino-7-oxononanoate synthase
LAFFGGCDYFRLSRDPRVVEAVEDGLGRFGLSVAASRVTTGNHRLYLELESALSRFFAVEASLLVTSGYTAALALAESLAPQCTHALVDAEAHVALRDAAVLLGSPVATFAHRDAASLRTAIQLLPAGSRPLVLTDGMFSRDGSTAPLRSYLNVLPPDGTILVDDAHGVGVLGAAGRGTLELERVEDDPRVVRCYSLSKAFGVFGGAISGSAALRRRLVRRSRVHAGSTPIPLPIANAALASIGILGSTPALRRRLRANVRFVRRGLRQAGIEVADRPGPIVAVSASSARELERVKADLRRAGVEPPLGGYPGAGPSSTLRFVISSEHGLGQLEQVVDVLGRHPSRLRPAW